MRNRVLQHFSSPKKVVTAFVANYFVCSWLFSLIEHKGPITGMWWGIVTVSTTGYGDYSPVSTPGRGVAAWLMVFSAFLLLLSYAHATNYFLPDPNTFTDAEQKHLLRQSAETNHLVRVLLTRMSGTTVLNEALDEFHQQYDPSQHDPQPTEENA